MQAQLVSIHSDMENDFLQQLSNGNVAWIGLYYDVNDVSTAGWMGNSPLDYTKWDTEAGSPVGAGRCVVMNVEGSVPSDNQGDY